MELREEYDREITAIIARLGDLEDRQEQMQEMTEHSNVQLEALRNSSQGFNKSQNESIKNNSDDEDDPPISK